MNTGSVCQTMVAAVVLFCSTNKLLAGEDTKAVQALEQLGARITRGSSAQGKPIIAVDLHSTDLTDARLKHLRGLKSLQTLILSFTDVTDAGLKELKEFKELR